MKGIFKRFWFSAGLTGMAREQKWTLLTTEEVVHPDGARAAPGLESR
jgi:hypothetical protein